MARKLKPLHVILLENPGYKITEKGWIEMTLSGSSIPILVGNEELHFLGKEISGKQIDFWPPSWFEDEAPGEGE